ncbi:MAG: division/cell wall cluster transcriptional repressor MraZ [Chloroflexota bacterium]|jgi:MraZ protein
MFLGEYEHSLDDKGRLAIPARFRTLLKDGLVITRGYDHCVMGLAMDSWQKLADQVSDLPPGELHSRNLQRLLFSAAAEFTLDKQGRILLPQNLRGYANIEGDEVVIVGVNKYFEIWSPARWQETVATLDTETDQLVAQLTTLKF